MTLTPAFSSGKLRQMFGTINQCADHLVDNTEEECQKDKLFDVYRYRSDTSTENAVVPNPTVWLNIIQPYSYVRTAKS